MLGRCRLRRGVSLEVIVEEDDTAEVALDPTPLPEEDDDDDDDEEDIDSEHGGSCGEFLTFLIIYSVGQVMPEMAI